jgi:ABC-type multidrug transport system permease subunit
MSAKPIIRLLCYKKLSMPIDSIIVIITVIIAFGFCGVALQPEISVRPSTA